MPEAPTRWLRRTPSPRRRSHLPPSRSPLPLWEVGTSVHLSGEINPQLGPAEPGSLRSQLALRMHAEMPRFKRRTARPARRFPPTTPSTRSAGTSYSSTTRNIASAWWPPTPAPRRPPAPCPSRPRPPRPSPERSASAPALDSADLGAKINPLNSPVTYRFEWGPTGQLWKPGARNPRVALPCRQRLPFRHRAARRTEPGETYHYRVIATNTQTGEESEGADRTFTTLPTPGAAARVPE